MDRKCVRIYLLTFFIAALSVSNVAQDDREVARVLSQFDNGSVKGNVYENKTLGLRIKFPDSMEIDSREEAERDMKAAIEMLRDSKLDKKRFEEMVQKDRIVFAINTPQAGQSIGAALNLTIKRDPTTESIEAIVARSIKVFTDSGKFKLVTGAAKDSVGGVEMVTFTFAMDVEGITILSRSYVLKRNGHLLNFSAAYQDEKELAKMDKVVRSTEFFDQASTSEK
ncbi:MAG: hypothetical protein ABL952_04405 [Pyrinomonadaceae bacterium]